MRIIDKGTSFQVLPQNDDVPVKLLLGYSQKKNDPWLRVEDNLVNRIVLNIPIDLKLNQFSADPQFLEQKGLQDFQVDDVIKLSSLKHMLNANPMGLGKTPETVCLLQILCDQQSSILIVTPKIIRTQWVDQIQQWWGREAKIFENQKRVTASDIWIVNYEKLRNESILTRFKGFQWDAVVLDEAHKIKNPKSQQTLAVKRLPANYKIALTGTPILRYVDDLWSILHFLDVQYSGTSYWNFVRYFCEIEATPWGDKLKGLTTDPVRVEILNKILQLVSVRNNAQEVAHGKFREVVKLPMSKQQRELYKKERQLVLDELPDNCTISNGAVLTTRLRQTTSWPGLFLGDEVAGPKFEWILEICKNNVDQQFVVFSVFEQAVSALEEYLNKNGVSCSTVTGKKSAFKNQVSKIDFENGDSQVIAGTIGALGQGYDGLQYHSRCMIFLDRDWSPEIMAQAEDRLHRMGQDNLVNIYYLECQGSFDQHVGRVNQYKSDDIRRALSD